MIFAGGPVLATNYRSIGDQWDILWDDIKQVWSDVSGAGIQEALIDAVRVMADLPEINHEKDDRSNWDKLNDTILGLNAETPDEVGMVQQIWDNIQEVISYASGGDHEGTLEIIERTKQEEATAAAAVAIENTVAEANRVVSDLLGSDRNWQRFFNFLTGRDVMMLGPSTQIDTLQEIWDAVATDQVEGLPSSEGGADSLNLQIPADRQTFKEMLANPAIYQRQFGSVPPEDDVERDAIIDQFINTVQGRTNFIVVGGMAKSLLDSTEGLEPDEDGNFVIPAAEEGGTPTPVPTQDFFVPTFDGTQQGVVKGVGDLIAGMSINPQEVQDRLNGLPDDQLALVQSQLWQFGYFDPPQGPEDYQWGVSDDSTYRAMERMLVDLLTEQRDNGPNYPVEAMLTERRKDRSVRMRESFVSAEVDEKRAIRNSVIQEVTAGMSGPLNDALNLALEESGVTLTTKGHAAFKEKVEEALQTVGMTQPELDAAYAESQRRDDAEMLLAAYYTNGSYVGDWSQSITVGGNTDSDWADFGIMAGIITPDEADVLYRSTNQMHPSTYGQRDAIRQKLEENEVLIARTAMNWWIGQQTYTDSMTGQQTISHVDALRGYANTIGRYTASMNEYDDNTFNQLSESLTGPVASQWLLDETQGDDIPGDVADRIAQAAVDALGLPDAAPDISGAGSIKRVLEALAGTGGPRGLRYG